MTLQIELSAEAEALLRERAREAGDDPARVASLLLTDALGESQSTEIGSAEWAEIEAGITRGDADFAANRFRSLDTAKAEKQVKFGLDL